MAHSRRFTRVRLLTFSLFFWAFLASLVLNISASQTLGIGSTHLSDNDNTSNMDTLYGQQGTQAHQVPVPDTLAPPQPYMSTGLSSSLQLSNQLYLPLIMTPPPIKRRSGIHLGARPSSTWSGTANVLGRLRGNEGGIWPAVIVVLSQEIYTVNRSQEGRCDITDVTIGRQEDYNFLRLAARNGTKIVIRVYPSPGNFRDAVELNEPHTLISEAGVLPPNRTYCASQGRDGDDIAREMQLIQEINRQNGFSAYFVPANEPNGEWYSGWYRSLPPQAQIDRFRSWLQMDNYFSNLYAVTHQLDNSIRILTPAMAQFNFAEVVRFDSCTPMLLLSTSSVAVAGFSGYDAMPRTYTQDNDGYSWNNYWQRNGEIWSDSADTTCDPVDDGDDIVGSHHVFQYFSDRIQQAISESGKPTFITEADLFSPCQLKRAKLRSKDAEAVAAAESLTRFIAEEREADYVASWLLTQEGNDEYPEDQPCPNFEIAWHEAYRDNGTEREWFRLWWLGVE